MADLLTPIQTRLITESDNQMIQVNKRDDAKEPQSLSISSPEDALKILQSKPDLDQLVQVLEWLDPKNREIEFDIRLPGPRAAQIVYALLNDIVPHYWTILFGDKDAITRKQRRLLLRCLSSVAGLGAIVACLRSLIAQQKSTEKRPQINQDQNIELIDALVQLLNLLLMKDTAVANLWEDILVIVTKSNQRKLVWRELVSLLATGRLLSVVSEANEVVNSTSAAIKQGSWLGDGIEYAKWLGRSIAKQVLSPGKVPKENIAVASQLLTKALHLGYPDQVTEAVFAHILTGDESDLEVYQSLLHSLPIHDQSTIIFSTLRIFSKKSFFQSRAENSSTEPFLRKVIGGIAALLVGFTEDRSSLTDVLEDWLVGVSGGGIAFEIEIRRAVVAVIALDQERVKALFQKALQIFGDKLSMQHTPVFHQEVNAQLMLLLAGRIFRSDTQYLSSVARSSPYINAISNRLAASSQRGRFLGIIVGTSISELVDLKENRMKFSAEDLGSADSSWYRDLTKVDDVVGTISDLRLPKAEAKTSTKALKGGFKDVSSRKPQETSSSISKIVSIEELLDGSDSEEDDLAVYEKPDSDQEDEDEDATLIQRNKPATPVYIRDLITGLRDTENFDRYSLAISTAPTLIRRKANFGTEVSDHIEELATLLVGLSDKYDMDRFQEMRLQGMISVLVAQPLKMGQWFSRTYFNGDYSMGQRASVLTTLSMGAREIAGFKKEDAALTGADKVPDRPFPSKKLPDRMHKVYAIDAAPVNTLAKKLERIMIEPMAVEAADKLSGPNALKVRTFSSRMEVEKKRKKPIANELAKIVADGFFFPLTGRWRLQLQAFSDKSVHSSPFLLTHFLKTLSLVLHASGASTLSLPQMTSEFWDMLLSLRHSAINDITVLEAILFALLTLLDINEDKRRLAEDHSKELLETQRWVEQVFEKVGGGSEEGERVRMLAAGVLMRTREVVEKYQRLLMGDLVDFM